MASEKVDCSRPLYPYVSQVASWSKEQIAPSVEAVSKVLGKNTFALNESVTVKWDMSAFTNVASGVPAIVLSVDQPEQTAKKDEPKSTPVGN
jgi:hypothetical protein